MHDHYTALADSQLADSYPDEIRRADVFFNRMRAATEDAPGVTRPSFSPEETLAHDMAAAWARELALEVGHDWAGNQYMTLPGRDRSAPAIMIGSHMDSVPHGGNFDGAAGVVMGLAALHRLRRLDRQPPVDITVMAIRAEEACWFSTHYTGSRMAFGLLPAEAYDQLRRSDTGRSLAEHVQDAGFDATALKEGRSWLDPARLRCFIEPHIEQGPSLVAAALPTGIVTGIRGNLRYKNCRVRGQYAHAGAVERPMRRDAVFAATEFAQILEAHWLEREAQAHDFVCTMGEFWTDPTQHTMTKISGDVRFTMDIRSESNETLIDTDRYLREQAEAIAVRRRLSIELGAFTNARPALIDAQVRRDLQQAADAAMVPWMNMASGAGHDCATFAQQGVACGMLFIRNEHGSHNPAEAMDMVDFAATASVLSGFLDLQDKATGP